MHYSIFHTGRYEATLDDLREIFPDGIADDMNVCLFSTSGVHGSYATIEDVEKHLLDPDNEELPDWLTFLIIHPRTVTLRYGNVQPKTQEDINYLKLLRKTSHEALSKIGLDI